MELPDEAIHEFQEMAKQTYGIDLPWDEAKQLANGTLDVINLITQEGVDENETQ